jgi:rhamnogalacturonan endolyase
MTLQNDGTPADAASRAKEENSAWPYPWLQSNSPYHSRGSILGRIDMSDGRPASNAAVFLGDNHPSQTTLSQGANYNYRTYADESGHFSISNVREGEWNLQAWPNGGAIGDVTTVFSKNDILIKNRTATSLGVLTWKTQGRKKIWQIGDMDRKATGFAFSSPPHEHARADKCPANLTYTIGKSVAKDWCFAQGKSGTWTVSFNLPSPNTGTSSLLSRLPAAVLSVSLAAYSAGITHEIVPYRVVLNGVSLGGLVPARTPGDPALYRSGTLAGQWGYYEITIQDGVLKEGENKLEFVVEERKGRWTGIMWDSVMMEFV